MKISPSYLLPLASCLTFACQSQATIELPQPLPQDPLVEAYFNHNQARDYTEPYRKITRSGDNLEAIMLEAIQSARSTIDIAVQEIRLPELATALAQQSQAGIKIRLIIENQYNQPISETRLETLASRERDRYQEYFAFIDSNKDGELSQTEINERDALIILKKHQIPLIDDTADGSKGTGLMHHKFIIIDGKTVIVTSANFTSSDIHGDITRPDTRGNANNLLKIESSAIAQVFTEEFNMMWGDGTGKQLDSKFGINKLSRSAKTITLDNSKITIKFSPNSSKDTWQKTTNGVIGSTLNKANQSINLALYVFSEQSLANMLENSHQAGVDIKALIDPEFIFRSYKLSRI